MTRRTETIAADWFDAMYRADDDPWQFRTSAYEAEKYGATLAALSQPRYATALEVGCAIGVFTAALAPRCDQLLAVDGSATALDKARAACADQPQVTLEQRVVPSGFPQGRFALIVLSEVLYYLTREDLDACFARCRDAQGRAGDEMVLCHWLGDTDYPLTGLEATERFVAAGVAAGYGHATLHAATYRLDRLTLG